jgi:hypothetical protein
MRRLLLLLILGLASGAIDAAPKKNAKGKGNAGSAISAKAKPLLKQKNFALDGKVRQSVTEQFYLAPDQSYKPTKIWGIDLPDTIAGVPMKGVVGRDMRVSFTGSAVARAGNQIKFEPKRFTGIKPRDGKPIRSASSKKPGVKKPGGASSAAGFDPKLPTVLILGDAISIAYTSAVAKALKGQANVTRPMRGKSAENCFGTGNARANLGRWLGKTKWDLILFNFGLEDLKYTADERQTEPQAYAKNLETIGMQLNATGAHVIFATTTPFPDKPKGPLRRSEDVAIYNNAAKAVMAKLQIEVLDLHAFVEPQMAELQQPESVQFNRDGVAKLATRVTGKIRTTLGIKAR